VLSLNFNQPLANKKALWLFEEAPKLSGTPGQRRE
jgi:hypothetical protein